MEDLNLIISSAALLFSLLALLISYNKLKISKEELRLKKWILQQEEVRYQNSRKKILQVVIKQENPLRLEKPESHLTFSVTLSNKSEFTIQIDNVEMVVFDNINNKEVKIRSPYSDFEDIKIASKEQFFGEYVIRVDQELKSMLNQNSIVAHALDPEGDVFKSNTCVIHGR